MKLMLDETRGMRLGSFGAGVVAGGAVSVSNENRGPLRR
jgi:hypothetical protein